MRSPRFVLILMLAFHTSAAVVDAQEHRASIRGEVLDPALNGLSNVEVRISREDTGESRTVRTDDAGRFSVPELPPAMYRVNVQQSGYGPYVVRTELTMNQ